MMKLVRQCLLVAAVASLAACATNPESFKTPEVEKSSAINNEGFKRMQAKDYNGARPYFERALAVEPNLAIAHLNLGAVEQNTGNPTAAAAHYRSAIANDTAANGYPVVTETTDGSAGTVSEIANRNLAGMRSVSTTGGQ